VTAALNPDEQWRLGHRPALDGLRGIAVLLVVGYHFALPGFAHGGATGVAIFFALSGFLITSLLLEEHERTGSIDFGAFYRRRARRLLPALFAMLATVLVVGAALGIIGEIVGPVLTAALYVANWSYWLGWFEMGPVTHTWTLAVEEQFYAAWPLVVAAAFTARHALRWTGIALGVGVILALQQGGVAILAGSVAAILMHRGSVRTAPGWLAITAVTVMLLPSIVVTGWGPGIALCGILATPAIVHVVSRTTLLSSAVSWRPLRGVGRISYALYLWHVPFVWLVVNHFGRELPDPVLSPVLAVAVFAIALASWRWVESPWLARRSVAVEPLQQEPAELRHHQHRPA